MNREKSNVISSSLPTIGTYQQHWNSSLIMKLIFQCMRTSRLPALNQQFTTHSII